MSDVELVLRFCAGLIVYRAFRMTGAEKKIAFYGFGSAANILLPVAQHEG